MSTITFRLDKDKDGWSNESELTFHLEDWEFHYATNRIEARPKPISLVWRICWALVFLGLSGWLASWLLSSPRHGGLSSHTRPAIHQDAAASSAPAVPPGIRLAADQSNVPPHRRQAPATENDLRNMTDAIRRMTEEREKRLTPEQRERREQLQQREQEAEQEHRQRSAQRQEQRQQLDRAFTILGWIALPVQILLILVFGWIGIRHGLIEVVRYPIDRISIARQGKELSIRKRRLLGELAVTRPLAQLSTIRYEVRRIGRRHQPEAASYHWLATLQSRRESGLPGIEFYIAAQDKSPAMSPTPPEKLRRFVRHLQQMTGCELSS